MALQANYTMCYADVLTLCPDLLDNIVWDTTEHTTKLKEMLYAKYFNWEIAGETIQEFRLFMETKFQQYADYYAELLNAYEEEFDWKDGDVETDAYGISKGNTREFTPRTKYRETVTPGVVSTTDNYDLPRSASSENRPSSRSVSTPSGNSVTETEGLEGKDTTTDAGNESHTGTRKHANLVKQRQWYLDSIRNVYAEFAEKFAVCFCNLFA